MTEKELREWIRENLEIHVEPLDRYGSSRDANIGLKFRGEDKPFISEYINIPNNHE